MHQCDRLKLTVFYSLCSAMSNGLWNDSYARDPYDIMLSKSNRNYSPLLPSLIPCSLAILTLVSY